MWGAMLRCEGADEGLISRNRVGLGEESVHLGPPACGSFFSGLLVCVQPGCEYPNEEGARIQHLAPRVGSEPPVFGSQPLPAMDPGPAVSSAVSAQRDADGEDSGRTKQFLYIGSFFFFFPQHFILGPHPAMLRGCSQLCVWWPPLAVPGGPCGAGTGTRVSCMLKH